jgi:Xaa-Pro aminopeptidase
MQILRHRVDALVVSVSRDLQFLTGIDAKKSERPIFFILPAQGNPALVCPAFERERLATQNNDLEMRCYEDGEEVAPLLVAVLGTARTIAVGEQAWFSEIQTLTEALPAISLVGAEPLIGPLRWCKSEPELFRIARMIRLWQTTLDAVLSQAHPGKRGSELRQEIVSELRARGGKAPSCTVSVGSGTALPHGGGEDQLLGEGQVLWIDGGIAQDGYRSDITRTYVIGGFPTTVRSVMETVLSAQSASIQAVMPGTPAEAIDRAAREVIDDAGFGEAFTHRVGHGLGLGGHEPPYLVVGNRQALECGMVLTIEPGIYLPGRFGVRLEDDILVTDDGAVVMSRRVTDVGELVLWPTN